MRAKRINLKRFNSVNRLNYNFLTKNLMRLSNQRFGDWSNVVFCDFFVLVQGKELKNPQKLVIIKVLTVRLAPICLRRKIMQLKEKHITQFAQFLREEEKSEITIKKYVCTRRKRITVKSAESGSTHLRLLNSLGLVLTQ